jgi:hypothetical protein
VGRLCVPSMIKKALEVVALLSLSIELAAAMPVKRATSLQIIICSFALLSVL